MKLFIVTLLLIGSCLCAGEPTVVIFGGNTNPHLTDLNRWKIGANSAFSEMTGIVTPMTNLVVEFTESMLEKGQYAYICLRYSATAPLSMGGFKNGNFNLNQFDFAGYDDGFMEFDANGWPCQISSRASDGFVYREYRLLNQPFSKITVTITQ